MAKTPSQRARSGQAPAAGGWPQVLDVRECAAFLRISEQTVRSLARRGELPGRKIGKGWRFSQEALLEWLNTHKSTPAGQNPPPPAPRRSRAPSG
jgi:excisionase family DNA binding protein